LTGTLCKTLPLAQLAIGMRPGRGVGVGLGVGKAVGAAAGMEGGAPSGTIPLWRQEESIPAVMSAAKMPAIIPAGIRGEREVKSMGFMGDKLPSV